MTITLRPDTPTTTPDAALANAARAFVGYDATTPELVDPLGQLLGTPEDAIDLLVGVLTDLRHFAEANLIDFDDADARAAVHFHHETDPRP